MLPPPQSSCAGWWFSRLWRVLLAERPDRHTIWHIEYPGPGEAVLRPFGGPNPLGETLSGILRDEGPRRMMLAWDWPGEDGMRHLLRTAWELGEVVVRPLDWVRGRQPPGDLAAGAGGIPWPLRVRIDAHGWHGQTLERAEIQANDGSTGFPILWEGWHGALRVPATDLPCAITSLGRRAGEGIPALILAGLTLPWRIDIDRDAWTAWRRLAAGDLLDRLGGPGGVCPRHGARCPWPATGEDLVAG
ncbi:MAG TPA: hypothetical protein VNL35_17000 [Chloroflexota bacterium]|nr:hypothetical protein [Chloroflexota bacterium]